MPTHTAGNPSCQETVIPAMNDYYILVHKLDGTEKTSRLNELPTYRRYACVLIIDLGVRLIVRLQRTRDHRRNRGDAENFG